MQRVALVVGVSQYRKLRLGNFSSFANNANAVADILEPTFNVRRLPEVGEGNRVRIGKSAVTCDTLEQEFEKLFTAKDFDTVLFYFSGHGLLGRQPYPKAYLASSESEASDDGYRQAIEIDLIKNFLRDCPAREQIVWLDCCYGGDLVKFAKDLNDDKTRFIITASRSEDHAYEEIQGEMGVFTRVLVEALAKTGAVERRITCTAIEDAVREKLQSLQYPQMPQFYRTPNKIIEFWNRRVMTQENQDNLKKYSSAASNGGVVNSQKALHNVSAGGDINVENLTQNIIHNYLQPSSEQPTSTNPVSSSGDQNGDPIYIERPPFERICRERIQESGCVLRITAPRETGKTMLVNRTIAFAKDKGYKIIKIDFKDQRSFNNLNYHDFLSHLCSKLSEILKFYCSNNSGSEECLEYLLSKMNDNLVLALDSFEVLFSRQQDCVDIGYFLRRCHNCSQPDDEQGRIWRKLRIVMAYSTEKIPNFPDINQSPFNIGTMVELKGFTKLQAKELLSRRYNYLDSKLSDIDLDSLVNFLNGHPKLIQQSLDHLNYYPEETMDNFLKKAPTEEGIFRPHLRSILTILRGNQNQCWIKNYRTILLRGRVSSRDIDTPFVLLNLGLIEPSGNDYISSCNLYLKYFSNQFTSN